MLRRIGNFLCDKKGDSILITLKTSIYPTNKALYCIDALMEVQAQPTDLLLLNNVSLVGSSTPRDHPPPPSVSRWSRGVEERQC